MYGFMSIQKILMTLMRNLNLHISKMMPNMKQFVTHLMNFSMSANMRTRWNKS